MGLFLSRYEKFEKGLPNVTGKVFVITGKIRMNFWMDEFKLVVVVVVVVVVCVCVCLCVSVWLLKIAPQKY
jgi:hypothetical protein